MAFSDSQPGKATAEFETIEFDPTESTDDDDGEIVGTDPKRTSFQRRSRRCRCKCLSYLLLLSIVACALYFTIAKVLDKHRGSTDYTDEVYTVRISAGATEPYYDSHNNYWVPDNKLGINDDFVVSVDDNDNDDEVSTLTHINDICPLSVNTDSSASETDETIYCTDRTFTSTGRYEINVPENNAPYQIDIYFAEVIYDDVGERLFDVMIEDFPVVERYDIVQDAGGSGNKATKVSYIIDVEDGYVSIVFKSITNSAKVNGIVVRRTDTLGDRRS